jgi:hypothetical protein
MLFDLLGTVLGAVNPVLQALDGLLAGLVFV